MDQLLCEVRFTEDETKATAGRLVGTLLTYEKQASDRRELFRRGAIHWPETGLVVNDMHDRRAPLLRVIPFLDGDALKIDAPFPDTQRARDAATNLREGILTGLSVEFYAEKETRRAGVREILRAYVPRAGLVDTPSYADSLVEVRAKLDANKTVMAARLWL